MAFNTAATMPSSAGASSGVKQRILFVLLGIFIYRVGAHITIPGIDQLQLAKLFSEQQKGVLGFFNLFSGGALSRMTLFALGVMPYITSSIIIQLMSSVMPSLEQLKKEGDLGRRKLSQYTRFGTLFLSIFQALGMCRGLVGSQFHIVTHPDAYFYFVATMTLVTGTMFLMWLGEQMTERGIGNGISLLIFSGIVSRFPSAIGQLMVQIRQGQLDLIFLLVVLALIVGITAFVVFMERAQRRIPIHYARRQQGNKLYQSQNSHLPLKINTAGVIPPIFATSIIVFPTTMLQYLGGANHGGIMATIAMMFQPGKPAYIIAFSAAIVFFCFFYAALVFNAKETATNLKKSGAFIPSIRPGEHTGIYIDQVLTRLTFVGALYLVLITVVPTAMVTAWHLPFSFGGISLLIVVVVLMDFIAQLQTHMMSHQYGSVMRKANMRGRHQGKSKKTRG